MAHIEDRWTRPTDDGRERTDRWGQGKRWRARWREPNGRERSRTFVTKADAELWLDRTGVSISAGQYVAPAAGKVLIGVWAEEWFATKSHRKPTTRAGYRSLLDSLILPQWRTVPLQRVTFPDAQRWVGGMSAAGLSASRVRQAAGVLSQILDLAVKSRLLAANPIKGLDLPTVPHTMRTYLTADQVAAAAAECGEHRLLVLTLAYTGLRWGEACALEIGDLDLMRGRVTVRRSVSTVAGRQHVGPTKTHRERTVPIPGFLRDALAEHVAGRSGIVFPDSAGGYLRDSNFLRRTWYPALERAGLPRVTVHELRHTAASFAIAAGMDVKVVQRMLGHSSAAMTLDVYGHLMDDRLDVLADALDRIGRDSGAAHTRPKPVAAVIPMRESR